MYKPIYKRLLDFSRKLWTLLMPSTIVQSCVDFSRHFQNLPHSSHQWLSVDVSKGLQKLLTSYISHGEAHLKHLVTSSSLLFYRILTAESLLKSLSCHHTLFYPLANSKPDKPYLHLNFKRYDTNINLCHNKVVTIQHYLKDNNQIKRQLKIYFLRIQLWSASSTYKRNDFNCLLML